MAKNIRVVKPFEIRIIANDGIDSEYDTLYAMKNALDEIDRGEKQKYYGFNTKTGNKYASFKFDTAEIRTREIESKGVKKNPIGRKLVVKTTNGWEYVFAYNGGKIITTDDYNKALPQKAVWANDDLKYFSSKFGNNEFKLIVPMKKMKKNPLKPGITARPIKGARKPVFAVEYGNSNKGPWNTAGIFPNRTLSGNYAHAMHEQNPTKYWRVVLK